MRRACRPTKLSPSRPRSRRAAPGPPRVDDDDVHAVAADQGLGDLERLLTGVRLADQQLVDVDAHVAGVAGVEGMLGVDEGGDAVSALRVGDDVVAERGLAADSGTEDLRDPAARHAAPSARSSATEPVGMTSICWAPRSPRRMMAPRRTASRSAGWRRRPRGRARRSSGVEGPGLSRRGVHAFRGLLFCRSRRSGQFLPRRRVRGAAALG